METCTEKRLVVDELLSFVAYKLNWMAPDTIIQLCSSFYSEEAVDNAKAHLYELCADRADRQDRCIKRSGANKTKNNVEDVVSFMMRKDGSLPVTFVARILANLPAVTFNSIDVSTLLARMETATEEIAMLKSTVEAQSIACEDLRSMMSTQVKAHDNLLETVSVLAGIHHAAETAPAITVRSTKRGMNGASRKCTVTGDGVTSRTAHDLPMRAATAKVDMKVSDEQKQCDKKGRQIGLTSLDSVTADEDHGSEGNTPTYAEAVQQWTTVPKRAKTVSTKTVPKGSAIIGSATNVVIRAAKLSDLRWANVFASRLDPDLTVVDLKSYLDSSLNLDVVVEQVKSTTTYSSFHITCNCPLPKVFLSAMLWPEGAYVRWWRNHTRDHKRENSDNDTKLSAASRARSTSPDTQ